MGFGILISLLAKIAIILILIVYFCLFGHHSAFLFFMLLDLIAIFLFILANKAKRQDGERLGGTSNFIVSSTVLENFASIG